MKQDQNYMAESRWFVSYVDLHSFSWDFEARFKCYITVFCDLERNNWMLKLKKLDGFDNSTINTSEDYIRLFKW